MKYMDGNWGLRLLALGMAILVWLFVMLRASS